MTDSEVVDWLGVALGEVSHYPAGILDLACSEARRTCTHHAQIIPTIVKAAETAEARHRSLIEASAPVNVPRLPPPRLSDEDFAKIVAERGIALSAMIDRGVIISNGDGTFRLKTECAA